MSTLWWNIKCILMAANSTGCINPIVNATLDAAIFNGVMTKILALLTDTA